MLFSALFAALGVVLIDVVLSGDNAVVIGAKAASLPEHQQKKAIFYGMTAACALRIILSLAAAWLLNIPAIHIFGGLALLYVAYGMWGDLRDDGEMNDSLEPQGDGKFFHALIAILIADVSMSIDNVLGVAGVASAHPWILAFGLILSIGLMTVAATLVAKLIKRYHWIAWFGFFMILGVAGKMFYEGYPSFIALFH